MGFGAGALVANSLKGQGYRLYLGDCVATMRSMPEDSVDAVVTDPPYGLKFMGKRWDDPGAFVERRPNRETKFDRIGGNHNPCNPQDAARTARSENQKQQAWHEAWAREAIRVLKPGGYLLAFGGTRTVHRLACAIEDAGFQIRDSITWLYGSGFPKSLDVSKAIDKMRNDNKSTAAVADFLCERLRESGKSRSEIDAHFGTVNVAQYWFSSHRNAQTPPWDKWLWLKDWLGFGNEMDAEVWRLNGRKGKPGEAWDEREVLDVISDRWAGKGSVYQRSLQAEREGVNITAPATEAAKQWEGWGTALKPAHEPIVVARKPLSEKTVARQVLSTGTGALNIDESRVFTSETISNHSRSAEAAISKGKYNNSSEQETHQTNGQKLGRWPANVVISHCGPEPQCPVCTIERADYEGPGLHMEYCPNCGSTNDPILTLGCQRVGVKRVQGNGVKPGTGTGQRSIGFGENGSKLSGVQRYGDPDDFEEVEAWECVDSCPVAELDRQSGIEKDRPAKKALTGEGYADPNERNAFGKFNGKACKVGHQTQGGASRFFKTFEGEPGFLYQAKAPASERWGILKCECEEELWAKPDQSLDGQTEHTSPKKDTSEKDSGKTGVSECDSSITSYGKSTTDQSRKASKPTTKTETSSTTGSRTSASLLQPNTSESTQDVSLEMASGGSPVASAESTSPSRPSTGTSQGKDGLSTGVVAPVTSLKSVKISVCERCGKEPKVSAHPTQKPLALMRYLVKLVTPPGGVVLDPFMGSGTTGVACVQEGFDFIGIEKEPEYFEIGKRRVALKPSVVNLATKRATNAATNPLTPTGTEGPEAFSGTLF